jgi:hypothetical protein
MFFCFPDDELFSEVLILGSRMMHLNPKCCGVEWPLKCGLGASNFSWQPLIMSSIAFTTPYHTLLHPFCHTICEGKKSRNECELVESWSKGYDWHELVAVFFLGQKDDGIICSNLQLIHLTIFS